MFRLLADRTLVRLAAEGVQLARRVAALDVAPASLLLGNDARVKRVIAEGSVRSVRRTSPAFNGGCCEEKAENVNVGKSVSAGGSSFTLRLLSA